MFTRYAKFLVVMALVLTTGLHWAALQTVAWTTMLAANLTTENFAKAASDTFDGDHPCPLCKAIAAAKKAQKKTDVAANGIKYEYPPMADGFVLVAPKSRQIPAREGVSFSSCSSEPVVPPPRHAIV